MKKNYSNIGKSVIDLEISALKKLKKLIGKSFNETIEVLSKCKSKVILCGKNGKTYSSYVPRYLLRLCIQDFTG